MSVTLSITSWILVALTTLLLITTLLPITKSPIWWVRGWDFPRLQQIVVAIILLVITAAVQTENSAVTLGLLGVQLACGAYQLWWIFPYTPLATKEVPKYKPDSMQATDHLRILSVNVLEPNRRSKELLRTIHRERPDILIAVETDQWWMDELDELVSDYPYVERCPLDNLYGMLVYSVYPIENAQTKYLIEDDVPSIHFDLMMPSGRKIEMHCIHPAPPSPTENEESTERDAELVLVAREVKDKQHPVIVAGDLNDVAWSRTTRLFRKISGLLDPRTGRGIYNTFHANIPLARWPLDHLFHSSHFALKELKRLPKFGSDHFPILADLVLLEEKLQHTDGIKPDAEDKKDAEEIMERVAE